jgi:raffinose/stachyose/melibiose transport system substrate-binding protein
MRRYLIAALVALSATTHVFATGGAEGGVAGAGKVTLSQMVSQGWTVPAHEELALAFTKETGIGVDWQVTPADQHHDLLKTKLNAGEAPDIFWIQTNAFAIKTEIDPEKNCIDFSNEGWVKILEPARLPSISYNGKVYGQTFWPGSVEFPFLYNKTLFKELGLTVPTTYQQFKQVALTIQRAGITPIYEHVSSGWHHVLYIMMIGGTYEKADPGLYERLNTNRAKVTEIPGLLAAVSQLKEFADLGFFGPDYLSNTGSDVREQLASRKVAMYSGGVSTPAQIETEYPDSRDEWGVFLYPFADNQTFPTNPNGPAMFGYVKSRYTNQIKSYFQWMGKIESIQYLIDHHPNITNLGVSPEFAGRVKQKYTGVEQEFVAGLKREQLGYTIMQSGVKYVNEQWMDMGKDLEAMFVGQMTPEQVVQAIQDRRDRMARAQRDPAWN